MSTVSVIDYGMGNLHSIAKALQHAAPDDHRILVTHDPAEILSADRVVFPGVGAIRDCMDHLRKLNLVDVIREAASNKPFLGICLGMQALLDDSEENDGTACLGIIPGHVRHFDAHMQTEDGARLKIPHMGWNQVTPSFPHPLWAGITPNAWFYFVHSYYACPEDAAHQAATALYPTAFTSAVAWNNVFAVQFHPEKSQSQGLRLLANFLAWNGTP